MGNNTLTEVEKYINKQQKYLTTKELIEISLTILYYIEDNRTEYKNSKLGKVIDLLQEVRLPKDL